MAERFAADWLRLRETADHRARPAELLPPLAGGLPARRPLRVLDLGAGRGSNLHYLAPRLPGPQHWRALDHDAALIAAAGTPPAAADGSGVTVAGEVADLAGALPGACRDADLVTASALLDLVGAAWVEALAAACAARALPALLALSYDGRIEWSDPLPGDDALRRAVNAHQRGDKGLGAALGPTAAATAAAAFHRLGHRVRMADSAWRLGPGDSALQHALIDGWVAAAAQARPAMAARFRAWAVARRTRIDRGRSRLLVGHRDLLALPPRRAAQA